MPVPKFTQDQLLERIQPITSQPLKDELEKATYVNVFTAGEYREGVEAAASFSKRGGGMPALMKLVKEEEDEEVRPSPAEEEEKTKGFKRVPLNAEDRRSLDLRIIPLFGGANKGPGFEIGEGLAFHSVAEVERLAHVKLWKHPNRAWRKCGGDPMKSIAVDKRLPRVASILLSTVPFPAHFVWASDEVMKRDRKCPQKLT